MQRLVVTAVLLLGGLVASLAAQPPGTQPKQPFPRFGQPKQPAVQGTEKAATPEQIAFFEKNIRPVLIAKCLSCHSKEENKVRGGLAMDTRDGLRKGGDSGASLAVGSPERSLLIRALKKTGDLKMPPKEDLDEKVIADFEKWIRDGAADPRTGAVVAKALDIEKGKQHWAFQPIKNPKPPATKDTTWARTDIDRFLLAGLESHNLKPIEDAEPRVLIRRLYFDLVGLPPTPEQTEAFVVESASNRQKAIEKVVDELLASPAFGERWGRHWLDVARYAESSGKDRNVVYPFAWRYRDYVIASFNADKPYNQFVREQIAGDLLAARDDAQKAEFQIATGYLAIGSKAHGTNNPREFRLDVVDEQIDALGQGMLALTIACARCHDHKFDPIPQKDYYSLAGIFTSSETRFGGAQSLQVRQSSDLVSLPNVKELPDGNKRTATQIEDLKKRLETARADLEKANEEARKNAGNGMINIRPILIRGQINQLTKAIGYYDEKGEPKKLAMGVVEGFRPGDSPVYERGEVNKPGATVRRGFPQVLSNGTEPRIGRGSGRKELADWIASADNPLTSRVLVNRVWLHLFGHGIVETPDNFGTMGVAPTHPELLDHLARQFTDGGWSVKKLVRTLVLTRAYQLASNTAHKQQAVDPDNHWFWRQDKKRLEAEPLRDAMLAISNTLEKTPPVASPLAMSLDGTVGGGPGGGAGFGLRPGGSGTSADKHRSVYLPIVRDQPSEFLQLFDFADSNNVTGRRDATTVPTQALFLMNNSFVQQAADAFATKLSGDGDDAKMTHAFLLAFGREPRESELTAARKFLGKFPARSKSEFWSVFCQSLLGSAEFRTID